MDSRETAARASKPPTWFALSSSALGRDAIEGRDGYTIMALPATGPTTTGVNAGEEGAKVEGSRYFICREYVGASIL